MFSQGKGETIPQESGFKEPLASSSGKYKGNSVSILHISQFPSLYQLFVHFSSSQFVSLSLSHCTKSSLFEALWLIRFMALLAFVAFNNNLSDSWVFRSGALRDRVAFLVQNLVSVEAIASFEEIL
uniref:Uncharacterized protein n=1 Tax=Salix viminalis TaxID=40686 RepID=A0A6N2LIY3_SALVM